MWRQGLDAGDVNIVLQAVPKAVPDLPKVPVAIELAKTEEARKLIQAGIHDTAAITRPYALPPGTPKDRVQILRRAFTDHEGQRFLSRSSQVQLDVDPVSGEEVEKIVSGLFNSIPPPGRECLKFSNKESHCRNSSLKKPANNRTDLSSG